MCVEMRESKGNQCQEITNCPDKNEKPKNEQEVTCNEHNLPLTFWCYTCHEVICGKCVNTHHPHGLEYMEDTQQMKNCLIKELEGIHAAALSGFEDMKNEEIHLEIIYRKFEYFHKEIEKCKDEMGEKIRDLSVKIVARRQFLKDTEELQDNAEKKEFAINPKPFHEVKNIRGKLSTSKSPALEFNKLLYGIACAYQVCNI